MDSGYTHLDTRIGAAETRLDGFLGDVINGVIANASTRRTQPATQRPASQPTAAQLAVITSLKSKVAALESRVAALAESNSSLQAQNATQTQRLASLMAAAEKAEVQKLKTSCGSDGLARFAQGINLPKGDLNLPQASINPFK